MTDTGPEIAQIQFDIFTKKPIKERLEVWGSMVDLMRFNQLNRIKRRLGSNCTESEIKFEIINENYGQELGPDRMAELRAKIMG